MSAVAKPRPRLSSSSMGRASLLGRGGGRRRAPRRAAGAAATSRPRTSQGPVSGKGRPSALMNRPEQNRAMPSARAVEALRLA